MILEFQYPLVVGPQWVQFSAVGHEPLTVVELELAVGQASSDRAMEAAQLLRQQIVADGGPELELREEYLPMAPPEPTRYERVLQIYLDRAGPNAGPPQRVIARWAATNHIRIEDAVPGWDEHSVLSLLAAPRTTQITAALTTFGWGVAMSLLSTATTEHHPLATPDLIAEYLDACRAEGVIPPGQ